MINILARTKRIFCVTYSLWAKNEATDNGNCKLLLRYGYLRSITIVLTMLNDANFKSSSLTLKARSDTQIRRLFINYINNIE